MSVCYINLGAAD